MNSFVSLRLITLPSQRISERDAIVAQLTDAAAKLGANKTSWIAPVIDGAVINAGHIVWRMESATESAALTVTLDPVWGNAIEPLLEGAQINTVGYRITQSSVRPAGTVRAFGAHSYFV